MRVFDCFTFFNELDLLEFRLKFLDSYVDYFVIAEADKTFSGNEKELILNQNLSRFNKWKDKIILIKVDFDLENVLINQSELKHNIENGSWKLESFQRNALKNIPIPINDDDIFLVGDLDEIPKPQLIKKAGKINCPIVFKMKHYNYFMNFRMKGFKAGWKGTVALSGELFKKTTPQELRDIRTDMKRIRNAGWHFSYLGGIKSIQTKLKSFSHTEYNKEEYVNDEIILKALKNGTDVLKRKGVSFKTVNLLFFPKQLRVLIREYPHFIKP